MSTASSKRRRSRASNTISQLVESWHTKRSSRAARKERTPRRATFETLEARQLLSINSPPTELLPVDDPVAVEVGNINSDQYQDVAALGPDGRLTVALNSGNDTWSDVTTYESGVDGATGLALGFVNVDAYLDVIIQGPDSIAIGIGDEDGRFTFEETLFPGAPGTLSNGSPLGLRFGFLNQDFLGDLVTVAPGTNEVLVFLNNGTLNTPDRYASGADTPIGVALGSFVGNPLVQDIAVAHQDGTVTFLEGQGDGTFVLRPDLSITGLGVIADIGSLDADTDGDTDLVVASDTGVTLLLNDDDPADSLSPITNSTFFQGLTGWESEGNVNALSGFVDLRENANGLLTTVSQTFEIPENPETISFDILTLGLEDPQSGIPDAFEVSLLDANGQSVVATFRTDATSFFNANPGGDVSLASGVSFDGRTVTLDITGVAAGTEVTLFFDLVGNPSGDGAGGLGSNVMIDNVVIAPDTFFEETFTPVTDGSTPLPGDFVSPTSLGIADVDGDGQLDIVVVDNGANVLAVYNGDGSGNYTREDIDLSPFGTDPVTVGTGSLTADDDVADVAIGFFGDDFVLSPITFVEDMVAPEVSLVTPTPGSINTGDITQLRLQFTEAIQDSGPSGDHSVTNPASYVLRAAGADGVFGTGDDVVVNIASVSYDQTLFEAVLTLGGPLPDGRYQLTVEGDDASLSIQDQAGNDLHDGTDAVFIFTVDNVAPTVGLTLTPNVLWPPNHKMVEIEAQLDIDDAVDGNPTVVLLSVTSNEPDVGAGTGNHPNDIQEAEFGTDDRFFKVRRERSGQVDGRIYTVKYLVYDAAGNGVIYTSVAVVPHDQGSAQDFLDSIVVPPPEYVQVVDGQVVTPPPPPSGEPSPPFLVVDDQSDTTFGYDADGNNLSTQGLAAGNTEPRGVAANDSGTTRWVVDANGSVYVYNLDGSLRGSWTAQGIVDPQGIAVHGSDVWIVDGDHESAFRYAGAATLLAGSVAPTSSFQLHEENKESRGATTDGSRLWVVDNDARVFVYNLAGAHLGDWYLDTNNGDPTGITLGRGGALDIWVVDNNDQSVYFYADAAALLNGFVSATDSYALAAGNTNPQGIADPSEEISIGEFVGGSIDFTGEIDEWTFIADGGEEVLFDAIEEGENLTWTLTGPENNVVFSGPMGDTDILDLEIPGQYTLAITGDPGNYEFVIAENQNLSEITLGESILDALWDSGDSDFYEFELNQSTTLTFVAEYAPESPEWVLINDDTGDEIFFETMGDGPSDPLTLGAGFYTLEVFSTEDFANAYQFVVQAAEAPSEVPIEFGVPVSGEVDGSSVTYTLNATAGQWLEFDRLLGSPQLTTWSLTNPAGSVIFEHELSNTRVPIGTTGEYRLTVSASGAFDEFEFVVNDGIQPAAAPAVIGDTLNGSLTSLGDIDIYTFDATAGDAARFDFSAGATTFRWALYAPDGTSLFSRSPNVPFNVAVTDLPASGTYLLVIEPSGFAQTAPGSYSIGTFPVTPTTEAINLDTQYFRSLSTAFEVDRFTFNATAGQQLFFDEQFGTSFNVAFTLRGPSGTTVFSGADGDVDTFTLSQSGEYTLVAKARELSPTGTGNYRFTIYDVPSFTTQSIGYNESVSDSITVPGEEHRYEFSATGGDNVLLDVIGTGTLGYTILNPDGSTLSPRSNLDAEFVIPNSGIYTIVVGDNGVLSAIGNYEFQLTLATSGGDTTTINVGDVAGGSIDQEGHVDTFLFDASVGQLLSFDERIGSSSDLSWRLYSPTGSLLFDQAFSFISPIELFETGQYRLEVDGTGAFTGIYEFQIFDVPPPTPVELTDLSQSFSGSLVPGQQDYYTFVLAEDTELFFDVLQLSNSNLRWTLTGPNGIEFGNSSFNNRIEDKTARPYDAGSYTLRIFGIGDDIGDYEIQIVVIPEDVPQPIQLDEVVNDANAAGQLQTYVFSAQAGQQVLVDVLDNSAGFPFVLRGPSGQQIFSHTDDFLAFLPETGDYELTIGDQFDDTSGTFSFVISDVPIVATPLVIGDTHSGDLLQTGETDLYTFSATAGQRLFFDRLVAPPSGFAPFVWTLYDENYQVVFNSLFQDVDTLEMPSAGPFTLAIRAGASGFGDYELQVVDVPPDAVEPILLNTQIIDTLVPGQRITYTFSATAGDNVLFDVQQTNAEETIGFTLIAPSGTVFQNVTGNQLLDSLPDTGTYQLVVDNLSSDLDASGEFRFQFQQIASPAIGAQDSRGTEFWVAFPRAAHEHGHAADKSLIIASDRDTSGVVAVPGIGFTAAFVVTAGETTTVELPNNVEMRERISEILERGVHIQALDEVSVYGLTREVNSTDAFTALPVDILGTEYITVDYTSQGIQGSAQFAVVATQDGTVVTITPNQDVGGQIGPVVYPAGVPFNVVLNAGEVFQLQQGRTPGDLTGTIIESSAPVGVFGSHECADIPVGFSACDFLVEQIPPTETWGSSFVTVPLETRVNGDTFRFVASQDNTEVTVNGSLVATLNRGQFHEMVLTEASEILATNPLLVVQYSNSTTFDVTQENPDPPPSDPFMMVVPPSEQFLSNYVVTTPSSADPTDPFTHYINLVVPVTAVGSVFLDGATIDPAEFTPIGNSGFAAAQLEVLEGTHNLSAPVAFGAYMYGYAEFDSYGYPGGMALAPIGQVGSLNLTPQAATLPFGAQYTATATVNDSNGNGLQGVRVDFVVEGVHPRSGFAVTDALGNAYFSFVGNLAGTDTITATVGAQTDSATVTWEGVPATLDVTSPVDGSEVTAGTVLVTGQALAGSPLGSIVLVTIDGSPVDTLDAAGNFFAELDVALGSNVYQIEATDSFGQVTPITYTLEGIAAPTPGEFDFDTASDITNIAELSYRATTFNRLTQTLLTEALLTNQGVDPLDSPVIAVFDTITPSAVALTTGDGTHDGDAIAVFDTEIPGSGLNPVATTSAAIPLSFENQNIVRFAVDATLLAQGNQPPAFTSVPVGEAILDKPYTYQAEAFDANGNVLKFSLITGPEGMSIDIDTGLVTWTPQLGQEGNHQVELMVSDGRGGSATQSFHVAAITGQQNRPPVFQSAPVTEVADGGNYSYAPTVVDADGDTLTFSLQVGSGNLSIDSATGLLTLSNAQGTDAGWVTIHVEDGNGGSADQTFFLSVGTAGTQPPVIVSTPPTTTTEGTVYRYQAEAIDPEGEPLNWSLVSAPTGMTIDANSGLISWTSGSGQLGPQLVVLQVSDGLDAATQTYVLNVLAEQPNRPPAIVTQPTLFATQDLPYEYQVGAVDPDGDVLDFELLVAPQGMTIDENTGLISWTPSDTDIGINRVLVRAVDGDGASALQQFHIDVRTPNTAPMFVSSPVTEVTAGTTYRYLAEVVDDDPVTFSLVAAPEGMQISARTGNIVWRTDSPDLGTYSVVVRATDERGLFTDQAYTLDVTADDNAPDVSIILATNIVAVGEDATIQVRARDDVGIDTLVLEVNGQIVALDANGIGVYTATAPGLPAVVATATDTSGNVGTATATLRVTDPNDTTAPTVVITSPESGTVVSYLTDIIGSVSDDNLEFYRVQYAIAGTQQWTTIAESTDEATDELLAVFDPTMLERNAYDIRVLAQDFNGQQGFATTIIETSGNAIIGSFEREIMDLHIETAGIPIDLMRMYSTTGANESGDLGYGWEFCALEGNIRETVPQGEYEWLLGNFVSAPFKEGDRIYITTPDCQRIGFTFRPQQHTGIWSYLSPDFWEPHWEADPGVDWELWGEFDRVNVNFSDLTAQFNENGVPLPLVKAGDAFYFAQLPVAYNPLGYQLINKDGTRYHYSQLEGLQSVTDRNGNTLTVTDDGIFASSGQEVLFQRDDNGRITTVVDPSGNEIHYSYNDAGELIGVDYPNETHSTYEYDGGPDHFLTVINSGDDPQSVDPTVHLQYGLANRLDEIFDGLGNSNRIAYDMDGMTETIFDALGNPTVQEFDERGNVIREVDPEGDEAFYTYDDDDNVTQILDEEGFETSFAYDADRNVTSFTDDQGNTTSFTYDDRNNITTQTDAKGNGWSYDYDERGNLVAIEGPLGVNAAFTYDAQGRPITVADSYGNLRIMEYGGNTNPTKITHPDGSVQQMTYNGMGKPLTMTDENGHTTLFDYDPRGRLLTITDPLGQTSTMLYNGRYVTSVTNKRGQTTTYRHDAAGRPIEVIDADGNSTTIVYNANGDKISETDALGRTTTMTYRADRLPDSMTDELGNVTRYEYDGLDNLTAIVDANGHRNEYTYDANGLLLSAADGLGNTTSYEYDAIGNLVSTVDPTGYTTIHEYDALNRLVKETDAIGGETLFTYDLRNNTTSLTDANGETTQFEHDLRDRLTRQIDAAGGISEISYDLVGNVTSLTDERGNATTYSYDELDRLVLQKDATGAEWSFSYTPSDQLAKSIDPLGAVRTYEYDVLDRLVAATDPLGGTWEYEYDAIGNHVRTVDPLARETRYHYDDLNRLVEVVDARGNSLQHTYDAVGNRSSSTDANGNTTTIVYDAANRLIETVDALGESSYVEYDAAGNVARSIDRNGRVTEYEYDELHRRIVERWEQDSLVVNEIEFSYDAFGNLLNAADAFSEYTYTYDSLHRITSVDNIGTPDLPAVVLSYQYDSTGNVVAVHDNSGVTVASTYDDRNLLTSRNWSGGGIDPARVDFGYDVRGTRTSVMRYGDLAATSLIGRSSASHDIKGRLTDLTHFDAADATIADYDYVRDLADQLTSETHHGESSTYSHDLTGQLVTASHAIQSDESYEYDANGNRVSPDHVFGPANQLLSDGEFDYEYDDEGNLIRKTDTSSGNYIEYEFDHRNRLVSAVTYSAGGIVLQELSYAYDLFDRLITRTIDYDGAGSQPAESRHTVYDGANAWADYSTTGEVIARYLFGDIPDEIIARFRPSEGTAWYLTDHLGTVRDIVDSTGNLINHIEYDSFGRILGQTDPAAGDRFTYTGREWDAELGMYYYRARFYDPALGRFVSQDPLAFDAGDANFYRYVGNAPLTNTDPSGMIALTECALVRYLNAGVSTFCAMAELWADGSLQSKDPAVRLENAIAMLQHAVGYLPGGSGFLLQLTMRAITARSAMDVVAPFLGPYAGMGFAIHGLYDAYLVSRRTGDSRAFLVKLVCTASEFGMMVWSARARCFVAGTPVVIGYVPLDREAALDGPDRLAGLSLLDGLGGVAILATATLANRRKRIRKNRATRKHRVGPASNDDESELPIPTDSTTATPSMDEEPLTYADSVVDCNSSASPLATAAKGTFLTFSMAFTLLVAILCFAPRFAQFWAATENPAIASSTEERALATKAIELIRPGDRVMAHNPGVPDAHRAVEEIDPKSWRLIEMEMTSQNGKRVAIRLLRPLAWIRQNGAFAGTSVWANLHELDTNGYAGVLKVLPCPPIQPGDGSVVTGTFQHDSDNLVDVVVEGDDTPIGCTANHLFWSEDRQDFAPASKLEAGERLRTPDGRAVKVSSINSRPGTQAVYNLEVDVEHVYYVGTAGILVHNLGQCETGDDTNDPITDPSRLLPRKRPTWQDSERDIEADFGAQSRHSSTTGWRSQVSFGSKRETKWGEPGSSRPDLYNAKLKLALDVKNYDLGSSKNRQRLYINLAVQSNGRKRNLPEGTTQGVILDIRGQKVSGPEQLRIAFRIEKATDGRIRAENVIFKKDPFQE